MTCFFSSPEIVTHLRVTACGRISMISRIVWKIVAALSSTRLSNGKVRLSLCPTMVPR
ncbi:Uncharacterised protein [Mycobacterium tuberculosis]|nr:Uncharacterised protein [Mycobacterium tuberculosis]